ncbi:MAG: CotH kinase family protein [Alistipes sp.]|nr:CotH kinase family protein [Alistipes sp.]
MKLTSYLPAFLLTLLLATSCEKDDPPQLPETPPPAPEEPIYLPEEGDVYIEAGEDGSLPGFVIGSKYSVDYGNNNQKSTTANLKKHVFDRNFSTFFASYDRSNTWVGLDLGEKHIITKIGYAPRNTQPARVQLAVIEGANESDFSDAVPIYLIPEAGVERQMTYVDINCSRGFRYVRYVSPHDVRCNLAELAFYGTKGEGDDSQLYQITNLPTVVINTENAADIVSKEEEISSKVYVISEDGTKFHYAEQTGVRGRGNASWNFDKKPYRLKFDKKVRLLDAPAKAKKWTLISNHSDKTLMRNILAFEISRRVGAKYTPYCQPVDVIINGEYKGCYQLCDQIEVDENRVNITEMEPEDISGDAITGGYLIEIDAYAYEEPEHSMFKSSKGIPVTIKSPDDDDITPQQKSYIESYFNRLENRVFAENFSDETHGYRQLFDTESFIKHFIVGEISGNTDTYWSTYLYKERGDDKIYTGPVWDFDIAFENDNRTHPISQYNDFIYATDDSSAAGGKNMKRFVSRIIKEDPVANAQLKQMWNELRNNGIISEESLIAYIDQTAALLDESQKLNFKRWKILDRKFHMNFQALGSYEAEVNTIKSYIDERLVRLDEFISR